MTAWGRQVRDPRGSCSFAVMTCETVRFRCGHHLCQLFLHAAANWQLGSFRRTSLSDCLSFNLHVIPIFFSRVTPQKFILLPLWQQRPWILHLDLDLHIVWSLLLSYINPQIRILFANKHVTFILLSAVNVALDMCTQPNQDRHVISALCQSTL